MGSLFLINAKITDVPDVRIIKKEDYLAIKYFHENNN